MKSNNSIDHLLLIRYLDAKDQLSVEEQAQIEQWTQQSAENQAEWKALKQLWEQTSQASHLRQIDPQAKWLEVWNKMQAEDKAVSAPVRSLPVYRQRVWQIAASVALLLTTAWVFWQERQPSSELLVHTFIAQDSVEVITLPDSSQVYLNEDAQLSYQEDFGKRNRTVHLKGEGYFEVVSNPESPFFVHIDPTTVRVVGTSFNINSLDQAVKVTVNSGKVAFSHQEDTLMLTPDEVGLYADGEPLREFVNTDPNYLSWKTGTLRFDDTPLSQVAQDIARHYQVSIQLEDEAISELQITSVFQNEPLESVLEEISALLDIRYTLENNQINFFISNP
ncbi:MAG: FecR domain-containing protein [Bacteroidota bacterium]